ncbi:MAG: SRPBCC family protein [Pseudonocardia sp.]
MAQVMARAERAIDAPAQRVRTALADYDTTRPQILTEHFGDYRVEAGGQGAGSRVHWRLRATEKRVRDCLVDVSAPDDRIVERDRNSSMVTTWTVTPDGPFRSTVSVETTWNGAGGIGGFFERTFAPKGLRRIYDGVLSNLDDAVQASDDDAVQASDGDAVQAGD